MIEQPTLMTPLETMTIHVDRPCLVRVVTEPAEAVVFDRVEAQTITELRERIRGLESLNRSLNMRLDELTDPSW